MIKPKSLNKAALLNLYNIGGKELVLRMIDRFLQNTPERLEAARQQALQKDLRSLHLIAHSLKATAANVGIERFVDLAEQLEELASLGRADHIDSAVSELEAGFGEAVDQLRHERPQWQS